MFNALEGELSTEHHATGEAVELLFGRFLKLPEPFRREFSREIESLPKLPRERFYSIIRFIRHWPKPVWDRVERELKYSNSNDELWAILLRHDETPPLGALSRFEQVFLSAQVLRNLKASAGLRKTDAAKARDKWLSWAGVPNEEVVAVMDFAVANPIRGIAPAAVRYAKEKLGLDPCRPFSRIKTSTSMTETCSWSRG